MEWALGGGSAEVHHAKRKKHFRGPKNGYETNSSDARQVMTFLIDPAAAAIPKLQFSRFLNFGPARYTVVTGGAARATFLTPNLVRWMGRAH